MTIEIDSMYIYTQRYYELILCRPDKTPLCILDALNKNYNPRFKSQNELTFDFNLFQNNWLREKNLDFDILVNDYLILMNTKEDDNIISQEYFCIDEITENGVGKDYKSIHCYSSQYKMGRKIIRGFKQVRKLYTGQIFNPSDTNFGGMLDFICQIKLNNDWTIGTVDSSLSNLYRSYDISEQSILELISDIEKTYNCVFSFDTINNLINVKLLSNVGENKGVILSETNYLKNIKKNIKTNQIVTRLFCYGKNNTGINSQNYSGQAYIDDFSFYRNSTYMSDSLLNALTAYDSVISTNKGLFTTYLGQLNTQQSLLVTKNNELVALNTTLQTYKDNEKSCIVNGTAFGHDYTYWHSQEISQLTLISAKQTEINSVQTQINTINANIVIVNNAVSYDNVSNFSSSQLKELNRFVYENTLTLSSVESEVDLYNLSLEYLSKQSIPVIDYTIDIIDLFSASEYQLDWEKIVIGDYFNIDYEKLGYNYDVLRLVGYTHNSDSNSLQLNFSNQDELTTENLQYNYFISRATQSANTVEVQQPDYNSYIDDKGNIVYLGDELDTTNNQITLPDGSLLGSDGFVMTDNPSSSSQMKIVGGRLVLTGDNWQHISVAISGDLGINADIIKAGSLSGINMSIGTGNNIFKADTNGIYLGNSSFASAPFKINMSGNVTIANGSLTITGGLPSTQVGFNYANSTSKGGNATDTDKVNGVTASTVTTNASNGNNAWNKFTGIGNTIPSGNVEFNFANSTSKGGNATNTDAVGTQSASTVQGATVNFNNRNDRKNTTPSNPVILSDGTAIDHTVNTDGSSNISFEWQFSGTGDAYDIDGFIVYVYQSSSNTVYSFGTDVANEQVYYVTPEKRAFLLYGVPTNKYYTFGIQAYRIVDTDINSSSILKSSIVKSTRTEENPYQPSSTVAFGGDITGTVNGVAATTIQSGASKANTALDSNNKLVTDVLSRVLPASTIGTPSTAGLYMGSDYLGFYNSGWKAYIKNDGKFAFTGDANNYVSWDGTSLNIKGNITMSGGSITWANVNAPTASQVGALPVGTFIPSQYTDALALNAWVASNYATHIDSSGVYTGTLTALQVNAVAIDASSITTGTLSASRIAALSNTVSSNNLNISSAGGGITVNTNGLGTLALSAGVAGSCSVTAGTVTVNASSGTLTLSGTGISMSSSNIGFFGTTAHAKTAVTGLAIATAGSSYTSNEQTMLQNAYNTSKALQASLTALGLV